MISIEKSTTVLPHQNNTQLTLKCVASPAGWDDAIFVMHAGAGEPQTNGSFGDRFVAICSLVQIDDLALSPSAEKPFYRVTEVTLSCRSDFELGEVYRRIAEDIQELVNNHKARLVAPPGASTIIFS